MAGTLAVALLVDPSNPGMSPRRESLVVVGTAEALVGVFMASPVIVALGVLESRAEVLTLLLPRRLEIIPPTRGSAVVLGATELLVINRGVSLVAMELVASTSGVTVLTLLVPRRLETIPPMRGSAVVLGAAELLVISLEVSLLATALVETTSDAEMLALPTKSVVGAAVVKAVVLLPKRLGMRPPNRASDVVLGTAVLLGAEALLVISRDASLAAVETGALDSEAEALTLLVVVGAAVLLLLPTRSEMNPLRMGSAVVAGAVELGTVVLPPSISEMTPRRGSAVEVGSVELLITVLGALDSGAGVLVVLVLMLVLLLLVPPKRLEMTPRRGSAVVMGAAELVEAAEDTGTGELVVMMLGASIVVVGTGACDSGAALLVKAGRVLLVARVLETPRSGRVEETAPTAAITGLTDDVDDVDGMTEVGVGGLLELATSVSGTAAA